MHSKRKKVVAENLRLNRDLKKKKKKNWGDIETEQKNSVTWYRNPETS